MVTSYLVEMPTVKTTVYLDAGDYRRIKAIAGAEGRSTAELIRSAVSQYIASRGRAALPTSLGAGRSGEGSLSERAEDLLDDLLKELPTDGGDER